MLKKTRKNLTNKALLSLLSLAVITSCTHFSQPHLPEPVAEIHPGILKGYLPMTAIPNSLSLAPPAPIAGSSAQENDDGVSKQGIALRGSPRWKLASDDANLMFPEAAGTFSCAINAPITKHDTPHLYRLLRRTIADAGLSTYGAKKHYKRPRPFTVNNEPTCSPADEKMLRADGSYPSGHTAIGWAWALILAEISPHQADAILARGWAFGQSRMICNVHWQSDVTMGRTMGSATVAVLHTNPAFLAAVKIAKIELKAVRANGLKPTRDCNAETSALASGDMK
ncbi:MAG: phosphatase PAP2 family protein [Pseudomonadales bacterium]|nr:phosphatase PAP2 family protein [Pseudomonadales bacterium]